MGTLEGEVGEVQEEQLGRHGQDNGGRSFVGVLFKGTGGVDLETNREERRHRAGTARCDEKAGGEKAKHPIEQGCVPGHGTRCRGVRNSHHSMKKHINV